MGRRRSDDLALDRLTRRDFLRATGATAFSIAAATALSACTPTTGPAAGSSSSLSSGPKKLIWGAAVTALRLDPQTSSQTVDLQTFDSIFDTLVWRSPDNQLVPRAAREWKMTDPTTWQFKLRPNVKWHNGETLTGDDVKFTFERAIDPKSPSIRQTAFPLLSRVDVIDPLTVNFIMKSTDPLWPARLNGMGAWLMPAKYFQAQGQAGFELKPIGTGPFRFVELVKNDHILLERNPDYWGGLPNAETILIRAIPEASARITALVDTGEINFTDIVPFDFVDKVNKGTNTKMADFRNVGYYTITPNVKVKPLDDKRVRQALSLAIDRQSIAKDLMKGRAAVPTGFLCKGDFAYDESKPPMPYDQAKAKALLQQAGYANEEIFIESQRNVLLDNEQQVCETVVAMWKAVGVNAKLEIVEPAVRAEKNRLRNYKGCFTSYFTSVLGDPDGFMWRTLQTGGGLNYGVQNDEFNRLGKEANTSLDQALRMKNYQRMNDLYLDELPTFAIIEATLGFGLQRYINFNAGPVTSVDFRRDNLTFS